MFSMDFNVRDSGGSGHDISMTMKCCQRQNFYYTTGQSWIAIIVSNDLDSHLQLIIVEDTVVEKES